MRDDETDTTAAGEGEAAEPPTPEDFEDDPAREPEDPELKAIKGG